MRSTLLQSFYISFIEPKADDEDTRRRELIFNVLLVGLVSLTTVAMLNMAVNQFSQGSHYHGMPFFVMGVPVLLLVGMYMMSRRSFKNSFVYSFIGLYYLLGTYALFAYGYALPEGLLTYVLVIIMCGILISNRAALGAIGLILVSLIVLSVLQISGISRPDGVAGLIAPILPGHIVIYLFFFGVIFIVSWLSSRDIERSLDRARRSEAALRHERNSLEIKVAQRTEELRKSQVEKVMQLQRFAEFGRLSSTLVHDLVNPLMSVSIELEQLAATEHAQQIAEARSGIASMERYIQVARRQLSQQTEAKRFDVITEIDRIGGYLKNKATNNGVELVVRCEGEPTLYGDSAKFDQFIANLLSNAIDAYDESRRRHKRVETDVTISDDLLVIAIRDYGKGISAADQKRVFDPFYSTKPADDGSGLGLPISKRTIEEDFGGKITLTSKPGEGSCFTVTIPLT